LGVVGGLSSAPKNIEHFSKLHFLFCKERFWPPALKFYEISVYVLFGVQSAGGCFSRKERGAM